MQNAIVWMELRAHDLEKAKKFYAEMFGWSLKEVPAQGGRTYVMIEGISASNQFGGGMLAGAAAEGSSSCWVPFFAVEDIAVSNQKAKELGAKIIQDIMEVPWGLVSTILDPAGATFSFWQAKPKA